MWRLVQQMQSLYLLQQCIACMQWNSEMTSVSCCVEQWSAHWQVTQVGRSDLYATISPGLDVRQQHSPRSPSDLDSPSENEAPHGTEAALRHQATCYLLIVHFTFTASNDWNDIITQRNYNAFSQQSYRNHYHTKIETKYKNYAIETWRLNFLNMHWPIYRKELRHRFYKKNMQKYWQRK